MRVVRVGLVGGGVVGRALVELLAAQADDLAARMGVRFEVVRVAVRTLGRDRGATMNALPQTDDAQALAADPEIDLLVEVAGGVGSMSPVVRAALGRGCPVVTANKALVAAELGELVALADEHGVAFACEAAAAGAVPVLRTLGRRVEPVDRLLGIVNGTCNFLLTRMEQDEVRLEDALDEARALGLAEADPSADIDGHDAAAKLSILAYRAFGRWVRPAELRTVGIRSLRPEDCDLAGAMGFRLRHLAQAWQTDAGLALEAAPAVLPSWHLLAGVEEEYNAVYLSSAAAGDLALFGKGAGGPPTATAVLSDMVDIALGRAVHWPALRSGALVAPGDVARRRYLRVHAARHPDLPGRIEALLRRAGLSVHSRASRIEGEETWLALVTSPCTDAVFEPLLARVTGKSRVTSALALPVTE